MKQLLKKIIPVEIINFYRSIADYIRLNKLVSADKHRFRKNASLNYDVRMSYDQIRYRLVYATHGLEKGFSHLEFRLGFGKQQLYYIKQLLDTYNKSQFIKDEEYFDMLSSLLEYEMMHTDKEYDLSFFYELFKDYLDEIHDIQFKRSGVTYLDDKSSTSRMKTFDILTSERFSVRDFSDTEVDDKKIEEAVKLSLKTPSACNRQMWKVRAIKNPEKIKQVLDYQHGFKGYTPPKVLFAVSVSLASFQFPRERNEAFVDGGLFSMSLLYSLEYVGLAACALNSELTLDDEDKIRNILKIDDSEVLILFIAAGNFLKRYPVCNSPRLDVKKVLKYM